MVVERVNPCLRPLSVLHRGTMSAIRRIPAFIGLSRWSYRVLVSYPRERLFVFGHTRLLRSRQPFGGMGEQPFLNRDYHTTAEFFFSPTNSQPCIAYHAYLSQPPQIGGRGLCSHCPLSVCVLEVATLVATGGTRTHDFQLMRLAT